MSIRNCELGLSLLFVHMSHQQNARQNDNTMIGNSKKFACLGVTITDTFTMQISASNDLYPSVQSSYLLRLLSSIRNYACCFRWVINLVSRRKGRASIEGFQNKETKIIFRPKRQ
jgi:hypothetical protein